MSDIFMTPAELAALTGFKSPRKQVNWLQAKGWRFEVNGNRRPKPAHRGAQIHREDARVRDTCRNRLQAQFRRPARDLMGGRGQSNFDDPPRLHRKGNSEGHALWLTGTWLECMG